MEDPILKLRERIVEHSDEAFKLQEGKDEIIKKYKNLIVYDRDYAIDDLEDVADEIDKKYYPKAKSTEEKEYLNDIMREIQYFIDQKERDAATEEAFGIKNEAEREYKDLTSAELDDLKKSGRLDISGAGEEVTYRIDGEDWILHRTKPEGVTLSRLKEAAGRTKEDIQREIDFLYLQPQASMEKIEKLEKELKVLKKSTESKLKESYIDLEGMIDLVGVGEDDEESGELIKFMRENGVSFEKVAGMSSGEHRFIGPRERLIELIKNWYPADAETDIKNIKEQKAILTPADKDAANRLADVYRDQFGSDAKKVWKAHRKSFWDPAFVKAVDKAINMKESRLKEAEASKRKMYHIDRTKEELNRRISDRVFDLDLASYADVVSEIKDIALENEWDITTDEIDGLASEYVEKSANDQTDAELDRALEVGSKIDALGGTYIVTAIGKDAVLARTPENDPEILITITSIEHVYPKGVKEQLRVDITNDEELLTALHEVQANVSTLLYHAPERLDKREASLIDETRSLLEDVRGYILKRSGGTEEALLPLGTKVKIGGKSGIIHDISTEENLYLIKMDETGEIVKVRFVDLTEDTIKETTKQELATAIYKALKDKGAGIENASIPIITSVLDRFDFSTIAEYFKDERMDLKELLVKAGVPSDKANTFALDIGLGIMPDEEGEMLKDYGIDLSYDQVAEMIRKTFGTEALETVLEYTKAYIHGPGSAGSPNPGKKVEDLMSKLEKELRAEFPPHHHKHLNVFNAFQNLNKRLEEAKVAGEIDGEDVKKVFLEEYGAHKPEFVKFIKDRTLFVGKLGEEMHLFSYWETLKGGVSVDVYSTDKSLIQSYLGEEWQPNQIRCPKGHAYDPMRLKMRDDFKTGVREYYCPKCGKWYDKFEWESITKESEEDLEKLNTISNKLYGYDFNSVNLTALQRARVRRESRVEEAEEYADGEPKDGDPNKDPDWFQVNTPDDADYFHKPTQTYWKKRTSESIKVGDPVSSAKDRGVVKSIKENKITVDWKKKEEEEELERDRFNPVKTRWGAGWRI